ncbi:glycosyltransferase family 2 protein [Hymenobacter sp. PAMC 26628]|uniref:glycosyltransferase family 2 protein n=1 Tax=Hymenobacter sp. PAMC 26628 TaxID=1484118 RepID=UPI0007703DA4|nr:glycosyltransferase [Hymenobacter sp. PAMC 26628]AMJ64763.1 hypothetical protein AXW84_04440 [Hymenobacter sp. PAMC 26628]
MKLVSIIIPCYNYGWLLAETLDSVLAQTYSNWECIVVDDGSVDATRAVAEEYLHRDKRFRYVYQENKGISSTRNHGIRLAQGEYYQFLDADDLLAPRKLETQVAILEAQPAVDLVYGDVRYFRHGNPDALSRSFNMEDEVWMSKLQGQGLVLVNQLVVRNEMVMNAPLLRAELVSRVGPFSERMHCMEDWDFWMRCAIADANFQYEDTPDMWSLVRIHPTSTSQNNDRMVSFMGEVREQLEKSLLKINAVQALAINKAELRAIRGRNAVYNVERGSLALGARLFWQLARESGRYGYYVHAMAYRLRQRWRKE